MSAHSAAPHLPEHTRRMLARAYASTSGQVRGALVRLLTSDDVLDPAQLRATAEVLAAAAGVAEQAHAALSDRAGARAAGRSEVVGPGGGGRPAALRVVGRERCELPPHPRQPAASA